MIATECSESSRDSGYRGLFRLCGLSGNDTVLDRTPGAPSDHGVPSAPPSIILVGSAHLGRPDDSTRSGPLAPARRRQLWCPDHGHFRYRCLGVSAMPVL